MTFSEHAESLRKMLSERPYCLASLAEMERQYEEARFDAECALPEAQSQSTYWAERAERAEAALAAAQEALDEIARQVSLYEMSRSDKFGLDPEEIVAAVADVLDARAAAGGDETA